MTTYKLLRDFSLIVYNKICIIPAGTIVVNDQEMTTDGYMAQFDLPPIPKLIVENNPDYFRKVEPKKSRELLVSIEDNNIIDCVWNDGRPLRATRQSSVAIFREVIK